jgi:hypothetical protein
MKKFIIFWKNMVETELEAEDLDEAIVICNDRYGLELTAVDDESATDNRGNELQEYYRG